MKGHSVRDLLSDLEAGVPSSERDADALTSEELNDPLLPYRETETNLFDHTSPQNTRAAAEAAHAAAAEINAQNVGNYHPGPLGGYTTMVVVITVVWLIVVVILLANCFLRFLNMSLPAAAALTTVIGVGGFNALVFVFFYIYGAKLVALGARSILKEIKAQDKAEDRLLALSTQV